MKSIQANLLLWLVGSLTIVGVVVLGAAYALTRSEIGQVFDDELRQVAHAVHLREDWNEIGRVRTARPGFSLAVRAYDDSGKVYFETALPSLPDSLRQTFAEGFARLDTDEGAWRVYTHRTDEGIVQAGQPVATRDALARDLALRVVTPMLPLIPALALLIGWVLKRGLAPLDEASRSVSARDASRLDPLPLRDVPEELLPLVSQINALLARLADSLDGQRRFLADAAHELRSPVAALALQVQLLGRAGTSQARAAAMAELESGVERTRRLVQQLLEYARLESGVQVQPHRPVDLARLARQAVSSFAARADGLGVDLGADAAEPLFILGNEIELYSLLENLIDNALRYAPSRTAVTVAAGAEDSAARLSVVDSGPGIPAQDRERVFERFHRVAGDATCGTGLGLAIAKSIVDRHHGSIRLGEAHPDAMLPGLAVEILIPFHERGSVVRPAHAGPRERVISEASAQTAP